MAALDEKGALDRSSLTDNTSQSFIAAPMPPGRSLLLDLPAELRNRVYAEVSGDATYIKWKLKRMPFAAKTSIAAANKQIHEEFMAYLQRYAKEIHFEIRSMRFGYLVTFLNKLPEDQLSLLGQSSRKFILHLVPANGDRRAFSGDKDVQKGLKRWIHRINQDKKGNTSNFLYVSADNLNGHWRYDAWRDKYFNELVKNMSTSYYPVGQYSYDLASGWTSNVGGLKADEKQEAELRKIERALRGLD